MATLGTGGKKESTEWEDILKSKGIIPEKTPEEEAEDAVKQIIEETVERYDPHENKNVDELDAELEEADSDEERILMEYRTKRIEEMKADACRRRFGPGVEYIAADDWKREVTEGGKGIYVVVHLFQDGLEGCKLMSEILSKLAKKFRFTKFLKCKSTDAIRNFPDEKCPALLVYEGGKVLKQFVGLEAFAGLKTQVEHVEWGLKNLGAVESEMTEPPKSAKADFKFTRI
eukprot:Plantae.Rhodophyta-Hildenbrandia_rubra.ctg913.p1 GENE.Plantae.Rhodophyta-Hildenbrandia_rubra.ctg913~~Plantae.Rhodophyta-Hildenbrandia_rubra.ctg913.p1  ORF type:complete len:230 (+),score=70.53 Plantae.Rhodophyta-Hildenbrandia_rubra.ctg913:73-762(+)